MAVFDFGTGGLDLAYEVMRGYDALVLVDVSRKGGEPGTLYVMDADPDDVEPIERRRGRQPARHGPAHGAPVRQDRRRLAGKVLVIACEPGTVEEMGLELSPAVADAVDRAVDLVLETVDELLGDAA